MGDGELVCDVQRTGENIGTLTLHLFRPSMIVLLKAPNNLPERSWPYQNDELRTPNKGIGEAITIASLSKISIAMGAALP